MRQERILEKSVAASGKTMGKDRLEKAVIEMATALTESEQQFKEMAARLAKLLESAGDAPEDYASNYLWANFSACLEGAECSLRALARLMLPKTLDAMVRHFSTQERAETVAGKQGIAREINEHCRQAGMTIVHPESGAPSILFAISDNYGGKFVLENRATKKRSHTTRDATKLLPFKLAMFPEE